MKITRSSLVLLPGVLLLPVLNQRSTFPLIPGTISHALADLKSDIIYRKTIESIYAKRNRAIKDRDLKAVLAYEDRNFVSIDAKGRRSTKKESDTKIRQSMKLMPPASKVETTINRFSVKGDEAAVEVTNVIRMTLQRNGSKRQFIVTNRSQGIWVKNKGGSKGGPAALIKQSTTLSSTATIGGRRMSGQ